jgi:hypothetical protein
MFNLISGLLRSARNDEVGICNDEMRICNDEVGICNDVLFTRFASLRGTKQSR